MSAEQGNAARTDNGRRGNGDARLAPIDPVAMARRDQQKALPKRFYKEASAAARDGAFALLLDGRAGQDAGRNAFWRRRPSPRRKRSPRNGRGRTS